MFLLVALLIPVF